MVAARWEDWRGVLLVEGEGGWEGGRVEEENILMMMPGEEVDNDL